MAAHQRLDGRSENSFAATDAYSVQDGTEVAGTSGAAAASATFATLDAPLTQPGTGLDRTFRPFPEFSADYPLEQ